MGDRYWLSVQCPECGYCEEEIYYAPTCGFITWECPDCGHMVNPEELTGISYQDASNRTEIEELIEKIEGGEENYVSSVTLKT